MKRIFFLLIASGALSATAQRDTLMQIPVIPNHADSVLPRWVIDLNLLGGTLTQNLATANSAGHYLNGVNMDQGNLSFHNGASFGFDGQLGVFFGRKRHWGVGTGIVYLSQTGNATLNNFHAEYESVDANGNIYRQVVTPAQPVKETLRISNVNIPLLLKYKNRFSGKWGFTADAGLLYNLQMNNAYSTNASFDYEAIYKYADATNHALPTVYDNSPTPAITDFLITKSAFLTTNPEGSAQSFFKQQSALGYGVGLNVKPNSTTGNVSYTTGSLGFMLRPAVSYYLADNVALNFGVYYLYQLVNNSAMSDYTLTRKIGDYSSVLNNVTKSADQSYGISVGIRFLIGKKRMPLAIISEEAIDPTACGLTDGMILLHGLTPGKQVILNYAKDSIPAPADTANVAANGDIKLGGLAAGAYSNITVSSKRDRASGIPVSLLNLPMKIGAEFSKNPTAYDACDGSITMTGLHSGQSVTVDLDLNGAPQPHYPETVSGNGSVTIAHLCAGTYTHIVVMIGSCMAEGADIILTEPNMAPVKPAATSVMPEPIDTAVLSTPIYFEVNKTVVHVYSYPTLEYAAKKLVADKEAYIIVNAYTDNSGVPAKNKVLSLKRAESVKSELVRMGVDAERIKVIGNGPNDPVASNKTIQGKALNRRAIIRLDVANMK